MQLQEISLDAPLTEMGNNVLVETDGGRAILRHTGTKAGQYVHLYLPDGRHLTLPGVPGGRSVRQTVAALTSQRPIRAFHLPSGRIEGRLRPVSTALAYLPWVVGGLMTTAGIIATQLGLARFVLLAMGITVLIVAQDAFKKSRRFREWSLNSKGETTRAIDYPLPPLAGEVDVDDVKEEYGKLLSDVVYRIEHPALFDPHEPTSKEFTVALLQWDNNDGVVGSDERRELARRVRATFAAARATAERIGMNHLPEPARGRAATALKAARLAVDESAPAPERETALRRAVEILDELALYYLPTGAQARKSITGGTVPQLPGRRSS